MRGYRCKCGHRLVWSSMGVEDCDVCEKCGSTLATHPGGHVDPIPHDWTTLYHQRTGEPYQTCRRCGIRQEGAR